MESILNQLYRGELHPEEDYRPVMPELMEERKKYAVHRDAVLAQLDEQTREKVRELLDKRTFVSSYEVEDAYVQGMQMGAKLTAALLKNHQEE